MNPETDVISYETLKRKNESELPNQTHKKIKTGFNKTKFPSKSFEMELEDDEPFSNNESSDPKHNEASNSYQNKFVPDAQENVQMFHSSNQNDILKKDELIGENQSSDEKKDNEISDVDQNEFVLQNQENGQILQKAMQNWRDYEVSKDNKEKEEHNPELFNLDELTLVIQEKLLQSCDIFAWVIGEIGKEPHSRRAEKLSRPFFMSKGSLIFFIYRNLKIMIDNGEIKSFMENQNLKCCYLKENATFSSQF